MDPNFHLFVFMKASDWPLYNSTCTTEENGIFFLEQAGTSYLEPEGGGVTQSDNHTVNEFNLLALKSHDQQMRADVYSFRSWICSFFTLTINQVEVVLFLSNK